MDGLIKGLVDVAQGGGGGHDHEGREGEEQPRDVQSRSSWAEVVSGDQDQDDHERHRHSQQNRWSKQEQNRLEHEWEDTGSRASRRPQKAVHDEYEKNKGGKPHDYNQSNWSREENRVENNDGWGTVSRKPPR